MRCAAVLAFAGGALAANSTAPTCPSTSASVACGMQVTATAAASCDDVKAEINDRIAGKNGWYDPHNRGTYAKASFPEGGDISATRLTGDGKYTDKMIFTFSGSGSTCDIEACSRSQVFSIGDFGTNYCNLKMLYCGKADGCKPVDHDFTVSDETTKKFASATVDLAGCLKV